MKVVISTSSRWHHFELAGQLHQRGDLERLYTGYPRFKVDYVPHELVRSFPYLTAVEMMAHRFRWHRVARALSWPSHDLFDRWVASKLEPCDILVCNHGNGLRSYQKARQYGARLICDSGQAHPEFIRQTLREEHQRWGVPFTDYDKQSLAKRLGELQEADLITVPSTFNVQTFMEYGIPRSKLARIPYGVDLSIFRPIPKKDSVFRVLFVGTVGIRKGLPYILQAFANLNLPNFEVVLIGGLAPEAKQILAKYEDRVQYRYLGFLPRIELYRYYSQGSVLVLPSLIEGLAYVQAQAMACGLPVIGTANSGAEDLFTDGVEGYIIPIRNPVALREKVLYLYENPATLEQMGTAARQRVHSLGGWDSYGEGIKQVYMDLCGMGETGILEK